MAFCTSAWLRLLSLLLGLSSTNRAGAGAQEFQLLQPQDVVSVSAGETLTLRCSVTGNPPAGPTKWFKGSGPTHQLVYEDKVSLPRVTRADGNSDTDFTIRISETRPEDAGTYRCVKFKKGLGADEKIRSGAGTNVSVSDRAQSSSVAVAAAAGTVCVLLVILLLVSVYFFVRKKRGSTSPSPDRSQTPLPDKTRTQSQPRAEKGADVLYADLQHSAGPQKPKQSAPEEHSEYAAIKVTQSTARQQGGRRVWTTSKEELLPEKEVAAFCRA